ncbi:hypothetical protein I2I05_20150 [Hymenobacter sp. BT683]|uniref:Uncharacterized protein n=1 Tax=Hymenobacter jeongseonensis TaxID=2791027 RepID=A0ABS0IMX1_9BACT|nr:hypothetical protein [Hymenobacter jeongseonensis]MBF9239716.1 hypothetical protein [Hymenobacter jeongseonensis]
MNPQFHVRQRTFDGNSTPSLILTGTTSRFKLRGLSGIVLIALGIGLACTFNKTSDWPAEMKTVAIATAYFAAVGGAALFSSFTHQLEFKQMKTNLLGMAGFLFMLLLLKL